MAHSVFHRSLTAGVALAGAGAIAMSTLPVLPTHEAAAARASAVVQPVVAPRVVTTEVEYVALVNALQTLIGGAGATVGQVFSAFSTTIPALYQEVGIGVPGALWEDADNLRLAHSMFGEMLFAPIAPLFVGAFTDAVIDVVAHASGDREDEVRERLTESVDYAFARLVGPIISAIGATGAVHQEIFRAGMDGNSPGQWLAILRAPGVILDGFLNGGYGDISTLITGEVGGERIAAPGLLTAWGEYPVDRSVTDTFPPVVPAETGRTTAVDESALGSGQTFTLQVADTEEEAAATEAVATGEEAEATDTVADTAEETAATPAPDEETEAAVTDDTADADAETRQETKASRAEKKAAKAAAAEKETEKADTAEASDAKDSSDKDSAADSGE